MIAHALHGPLVAAAFAAISAVIALVVAPPAQAQAQSSVTGPDCSSYPCGKIVSIRQTLVKQQWTPLGTGVGVGGTISSDTPSAVTSLQLGPGLSNQGLVVLGSAGGASYKKAPNSYQQPRWEVTVKLDNGMTRVVTLAYEPFVQEGDRVRVAGNSVELAD